MTGRKAFLSNTAWKAVGSTPCWSNPEQLMVKVSALPVESRDSVREGLHGASFQREKAGDILGEAGEPSFLYQNHPRPSPSCQGRRMSWSGRQMVEVYVVSWVRALSSFPLYHPHAKPVQIYMQTSLAALAATLRSLSGPITRFLGPPSRLLSAALKRIVCSDVFLTCISSSGTSARTDVSKR